MDWSMVNVAMSTPALTAAASRSTARKVGRRKLGIDIGGVVGGAACPVVAGVGPRLQQPHQRLRMRDTLLPSALSARLNPCFLLGSAALEMLMMGVLGRAFRDLFRLRRSLAIFRRGRVGCDGAGAGADHASRGLLSAELMMGNERCTVRPVQVQASRPCADLPNMAPKERTKPPR